MLVVDELRGKGVGVDANRCLRMALLHDWAEARVGDIPKTAASYYGDAIRKSAESSAFADIAQGLGDNDLYKDLFEEYEKRQTLEARLVKAADIIDLLVQVLTLERSGSRGLDEFWEAATDSDFQLGSPADEVIAGYFDSLLEERRTVII